MGGSPEKEVSLESTCTPPTHPVCPTSAGPQSWEQPGCTIVLQKDIGAATEAATNRRIPPPPYSWPLAWLSSGR